MKTTMTPLRPLIFTLACIISAFAAKAQERIAKWQTDNHYTNTFQAMSHGHNDNRFVHAMAADSESVYKNGKQGLAFVFKLDANEIDDWTTYLRSAVVESGNVHFMPVRECVESQLHSYCDYVGHIGNERFGMRQYLYGDTFSTYLLRILFKANTRNEAMLKAAEDTLIYRHDQLANMKQ